MTNETAKYAYATVLTESSQLAGVTILAYTLRKHKCQYPLIVLFSSSLPPDQLRALRLQGQQSNFQLRPCPFLDQQTRDESNIDCNKKHDERARLSAFGLVDHDLVCYLSVNSIVLKIVDSIFTGHGDLPPDSIAASPQAGSSTPNVPFQESTNDLFDTSMFVCKPSEPMWTKILKLQDVSSTDASSKIFSDERCRRLSRKYDSLDPNAEQKSNNEIARISYDKEQPWSISDERSDRGGQHKEYFQYWWKEYAEWRHDKSSSKALVDILSTRMNIQPPVDIDVVAKEYAEGSGESSDNKKDGQRNDPAIDRTSPEPGGPVLRKKVLGEHGHGPRVRASGSSQMLL